MKTKIQNCLLCLLMLTFPVIQGCNKVEVNDTAIPLGLGVEWQNNIFTVYGQMAKPTTPEKGPTPGQAQFTVVSATGRSISEAGRNVTLSMPRDPLWSHAGIILIGENLAKTDMALFADYQTRTRVVRKNIPVVITRNANPGEVMQVQTPLEPYSALAIDGILRNQEKQLGIYMPVILSDVLEKFATPGVEPVIPQIIIQKEGSKEYLKPDGTAVFRDRKMVGSLNEMESRGFRYVKPGMIQGGIIIIPSPMDQQKRVTLELTRSKASVKPEIKKGIIKMKIELNAEGNYYEQNSTGDVLTLKNIPKIENLANQEIAREITACINKAQSLQSDIFGWGRMIEGSNPKLWKEYEKDWQRIFPGIEYDIKVKFQLRRSYLTDQSFFFNE